MSSMIPSQKQLSILKSEAKSLCKRKIEALCDTLNEPKNKGSKKIFFTPELAKSWISDQDIQAKYESLVNQVTPPLDYTQTFEIKRSADNNGDLFMEQKIDQLNRYVCALFPPGTPFDEGMMRAKVSEIYKKRVEDNNKKKKRS